MPRFSSSRRSMRSMKRRSWSAATLPSAMLDFPFGCESGADFRQVLDQLVEVGPAGEELHWPVEAGAAGNWIGAGMNAQHDGVGRDGARVDSAAMMPGGRARRRDKRGLVEL